jgi:hypothetical protein
MRQGVVLGMFALYGIVSAGKGHPQKTLIRTTVFVLAAFFVVWLLGL